MREGSGSEVKKCFHDPEPREPSEGMKALASGLGIIFGPGAGSGRGIRVPDSCFLQGSLSADSKERACFCPVSTQSRVGGVNRKEMEEPPVTPCMYGWFCFFPAVSSKRSF